MQWFKYLIFAIFVLEAIGRLAYTAGVEEKRYGRTFQAFSMVVNTLMAIGIWYWVIN